MKKKFSIDPRGHIQHRHSLVLFMQPLTRRLRITIVGISGKQGRTNWSAYMERREKESGPHVANTRFVVCHTILKIQNNLKVSKSFLLYNTKIISLELETDSCLYAIVLKTSTIIDPRARRNHRRLYTVLYSYFYLKRFRDFIFFILCGGVTKA